MEQQLKKPARPHEQKGVPPNCCSVSRKLMWIRTNGQKLVGEINPYFILSAF